MAVGTHGRIAICDYNFEGPFTDARHLRDEDGVYAILDKRSNGKWWVLDVGESEQIRTRVESHGRQDCWSRHRQGTLGYAACYTPGWTDEQRRALERRIRDAFNPPCGDQ